MPLYVRAGAILPLGPVKQHTSEKVDAPLEVTVYPGGTALFELLTWRGLATYYVLFFLHLETRRVTLAGITRRPTEAWITQMARNALDETSGGVRRCRYVLHDRDAKFSTAFEGVHGLKFPPRSPNLNAFAERRVRSVKQECLSKLILFGERSLQRALTEFTAHHHSERNHQGKGNSLLFPGPVTKTSRREVRCRERLGGLLRFYCRAA